MTSSAPQRQWSERRGDGSCRRRRDQRTGQIGRSTEAWGVPLEDLTAALRAFCRYPRRVGVALTYSGQEEGTGDRRQPQDSLLTAPTHQRTGAADVRGRPAARHKATPRHGATSDWRTHIAEEINNGPVGASATSHPQNHSPDYWPTILMLLPRLDATHVLRGASVCV